MPDNGRDIIGALVVGDEDTGPVGGDILLIFKSKAGAKDIQAAQQEKIEDIHAFLMGLITPKLQGDPLDGMEYQQGEEKEKIKDDGKRVCEELL